MPEWHRGTAYTHPEFDRPLFILNDLGVIVLDEPVYMSEYGELAEEGYLDSLTRQQKSQQRFTPVGYGLERLLPIAAEGGSTRRKADAKLITLNSTGNLPDGTFAFFSNNDGAVHQGGTCPGDSGGPVFVAGTRTIVAVNSFSISPACPSGVDGGYRIDQGDDLGWLEEAWGLTP